MRIDARQASTIRKVLRYVGPVVLGIGIIMLAIGVIHTVAALKEAGAANIILVIFAGVAIPMIPVGFAMTMFGFAGRGVRQEGGGIAGGVSAAPSRTMERLDTDRSEYEELAAYYDQTTTRVNQDREQREKDAAIK